MTNSGPFIERCPHDRENPYAQINRELIRDERLHPSTRWMLIYLLSMKDGWKISPQQLKKHCEGHHGCGRDKIYDWIKEAIEYGYMKKEEWQEGGLNRCRYLLSEFPKFKKCLPDPDVQDPVDPDPVNTYYKKEHILKKKHIKKESTLAGAKESAPTAKPPARHARAPHVSTSSEDHEKLIKEFGEETVKKAYEKLSEWKSDTPKSKWKKNDHLAIKRWVIDALKEESQKALKGSKSDEKRIKEVQQWLRTGPCVIDAQKAFKQGKLKVYPSYVDFTEIPDGRVLFTNPKAEELIEHYLKKM